MAVLTEVLTEVATEVPMEVVTEARRTMPGMARYREPP
jgi:hypothetical protein